MSVESDLGRLLATMSPEPRLGTYVFVVVTDRRNLPRVEVLASVDEPEGLTLVTTREDADRAGLGYDFVAGWITLQVHSALAAVGLTASVSTALADAGISCNVLAGYHHDHLLVPVERLDEALGVLRRVSARASTDHGRMQPPVAVRPARPEDAVAMARLAKAAYEPYVQRIGRQPAPMTADYTRVVAEGGSWVAERDDRLVGLLVLAPAKDHLSLENVAVAPDAQGLGVGRRLLRLAEEQARAECLPEIRLFTNEAMTENLAFYPRHGYRESHRATQDGYRRVFFTKLVPSARPRSC